MFSKQCIGTTTDNELGLQQWITLPRPSPTVHWDYSRERARATAVVHLSLPKSYNALGLQPRTSWGYKSASLFLTQFLQFLSNLLVRQPSLDLIQGEIPVSDQDPKQGLDWLMDTPLCFLITTLPLVQLEQHLERVPCCDLVYNVVLWILPTPSQNFP